ncbi:MarR family winged helix-turn-helix transcriptional regulator [Kutzneria sp. CA-103260]|uniref:MarR family winged helix-turn-helix transcriptional regulator n=1 Tax=Kutzneria sp. CA-103260 TaxID=2802641 RepID=UPI001BAC7253|nr:MarR family transcriptional regulator [Kutzneria sp. CA-103260]QUQ71320.1 MarR family transcriptional regulator [Kutzneria sp. CA-103260]
MAESHEVLRAIARWQIPVIQLNGMIAEHLGLNWTDLQALYVLANQGPATAGELARRVTLTSGSASRMIERLVQAGYVRRVPDPHDRRRVLIEPDPEAVHRVGSLYERLNASHLRDLSHLDDTELSALLRFITAATERTEEEIQRFPQ